MKLPLRWLLDEAAAPPTDGGALGVWLAGLAARHPAPFARAVAGGAASDRLAWAFAAGYQAALRTIVPGLSDDGIVSFCVTEAGGAHPRAIATGLTGTGDALRVTGRKTFATLAGDAATLLIVAALGGGAPAEGPGERPLPRLRVVRVAPDRPGVRIRPLPPTPFTPEVGHVEVFLDDVAVTPDELLPGDGYARYVKPFRTVEDVHVHAALVAYVAGASRRHGGPPAVIEQAAAVIAALGALAGEDPSDPATHVALGGALALGRALLDEATGWLGERGDEGVRWLRDRPLLQVAEGVRAARLQAAWRTLGGGAQES